MFIRKSSKCVQLDCHSLIKKGDELEYLCLIQSLFNTSDLPRYESYRFDIHDSNIFSVFVNQKGLWELCVKNLGTISFYNSNGTYILVDLSGKTVFEVIKKFDLSLSNSSTCIISCCEYEDSIFKKFVFTLSKISNKISRTALKVESSERESFDE